MRLLSALLLGAVALHPSAIPAGTLLEAGDGTIWRYLDDGTPPDAAWREAGFDDSKWKSGKAPLGYGDPGMGTEISWGADKAHKPVTVWFRRTFEAPELKEGERAVLVLCVDDGAAIYLNGKEIGRTNLPAGPLAPDTPAPRSLSDSVEGFYLRLPVPVQELHPGRNVLAAEVHQCSPSSSDLFFDLALKTVPPDAPAPALRDSARWAVNTFRRQHYLGPGVAIPDGYEDGGRGMKLDAGEHPSSGREILLVDRTNDVVLARDLAFARSPELQPLPPLERALRLAVYIEKETTPPGGARWDEKTCDQFEKEVAGKPVLLGEWIDQTHAGVCRHRSLLFKILADEAGLKSALVRGNYGSIGGHAWNELFLDDGRRVLVDVMLKGGKQDFPEVNSPEVAQHYLKVNGSPWYEQAAKTGDTKTGDR